MTPMTREMAAYATVSATAFASDVATLATLIRMCHWHYLVASTVSFLVGAAVAYVLSVRFVFSFRRVANRQAEFAAFTAIGSVGLLANAAVMAGAVEILNLHYMIAKILSGGTTFLLNYSARRLLLFTPPRDLRNSK